MRICQGRSGLCIGLGLEQSERALSEDGRGHNGKMTGGGGLGLLAWPVQQHQILMLLLMGHVLPKTDLRRTPASAAALANPQRNPSSQVGISG
jgi:hypothetical protein